MSHDLGLVAFYVFAGVAGIQVLYYLVLFSRVAFFKNQLEAETPPNAAVSVIICAKNEEHNLQKYLPAILQQRYGNGTPAYEVIVVNDNSEDDSKYYLRSIEPGYSHFRQIEIKQSAQFIPGKKYPLSIGLKGARHDHVLLTDADCKPASTHWLSLMSQGFADGKEIVLGYGAYVKQPGFLNKMIRYETFFSALQYLSYALAGVAYMGVGRNLAYKRDLFFRHKGFTSHQHIASGDDDLFVNMAATPQNVSVVIDKNAFTYSEAKSTWKAWFQQKTRHMSTGRHYRFVHKFFLGLFTASQLLFYPLLIVSLFYRPMLEWTLGILGAKLLVQSIITYPAMKKLDEQDLFWYSWLMDALMVAYYIIFIPALLLKPKPNKWK